MQKVRFFKTKVIEKTLSVYKNCQQ